ncbi:MAG: 4Fe-4S binding protein [Candidatus Marinimicrobia bacterium]|nr:4Fe-4S binding protein [Candidatus Neomarinimicrobiota bacterium]
MIIQNERCDLCGTCIAVCPEDALTLHEHGLIIDREKCTECLLCVNICPVAALENKNEK